MSGIPEEAAKFVKVHSASAALEAAGYHYVPAGRGARREADQVLRQVGDAAKGFEWKGQEDYDVLGGAVSDYLYAMLEDTYHLRRHEVSQDAAGEDFVSVPVFESKLDSETVCVLIQGSGAVTPGMWARSLCINESLHEGTIFPYVKAAQERGWGVLVANPNTKASGNECAELHTRRLFDTFILPSKAKKVVVVAHSYGGWSMLYHLKTCSQEAREKISCVAFTDSVHHLTMTVPTDAAIAKAEKPDKLKAKQKHREELKALIPEAFEAPSAEVLAYLKEKACNWVMSKEPLDTPIEDENEGVRTLSSGHHDHVWTSGTSFPAVFRFLDSFLPLRALTHTEKLEEADRLKAAGNKSLKEGSYKGASFSYKQAMIFLKGVLATGGEDEVCKVPSKRK